MSASANSPVWRWYEPLFYAILARMSGNYTIAVKKIESVLESFLPNMPSQQWYMEVFGDLASAESQSLLAQGLLEPCRSLMSRGGKRWRPLLLVLCAEAAADDAASDELIQNACMLAPLVEFAHTASLIHDDIEDSSDTRRGMPAVHCEFGMDRALNAGSWLYFLAPLCIERTSLESPVRDALRKRYERFLRALHAGQALDIGWHRDASIIPSAEAYGVMAQLKTGGLASLAAGVGVLAAGGGEEEALGAEGIAARLGLAFQIADDAVNLAAGNPGKKQGDDIVEGKKSYPLILHLQKHPEDHVRIAAYIERARHEGDQAAAIADYISLISQSGAIDEAMETARTLVMHAKEDLLRIFPRGRRASESIIDLFTKMLPKA